MILIADSGSTKTSWALIDNGYLKNSFTTEGLNPLTSTQDKINKVLQEVLVAADIQPVNQIYFYGAGCGTTESQRTILTLLQSVFAFATIEVESDLLGACRALCGNEKGLVGILGTGSNACQYDGNIIQSRIPSLGFILGDEGSGNHIGRVFLKEYFSGAMPNELRIVFKQQYNIELSNVLDNIYHQPSPNRYLAQFARFALQNRQHKYTQTLLHQAFTQFITTQVLPIGSGTLHLVGSIAHTFQQELAESAQNCNIKIGKVIKEPIEGLILYHLGSQ